MKNEDIILQTEVRGKACSASYGWRKSLSVKWETSKNNVDYVKKGVVL